MAVRNQVASLFGATPQQIMEQQAREQAQMVQQIRDPYQQVGTAIGVGLGRLFGGESEEVAQARQMQEALQGVNPEDPAQLRELARTVQTFAPERSLQLLDRAMQIENQGLAREADELAITYRQKQIEAQDATTAEKKRKEAEAQKAKEKAVEFFTKKEGGAEIAQLIDMNILDASAGYKAYADARNKNIELREQGLYTTPDGNEVIAGFDKRTNTLVQYTPSGWLPVPDPTGWIPGRGSASTSQIKQGRSIAGQVKKDYETQFDALVDTGFFIDALVDTGFFTDTSQEQEIQRLTGIENITSKDGKQELYRRAEQIFANNPGLTEREALERALSGERVTTPTVPQQSQTTNKPDLSAVKAQ